MFRKLRILLIFSKLKVTKLLMYNYLMHNLYAIFAKVLSICKQMAGNLVMNATTRKRHKDCSLESSGRLAH